MCAGLEEKWNKSTGEKCEFHALVPYFEIIYVKEMTDQIYILF